MAQLKTTKTINYQPIGPKLHGIMDYGLMTINMLAPTVLKLDTSAAALSYTFGGMVGGLNSFTDQPYAIKKAIPFKMHGMIDMATLPAMLILPMLTGDMKKPKARAFFLASFGLALANFLLTNFKANERTAA